jgi:hypothetical protein
MGRAYPDYAQDHRAFYLCGDNPGRIGPRAEPDPPRLRDETFHRLEIENIFLHQPMARLENPIGKPPVPMLTELNEEGSQ